MLRWRVSPSRKRRRLTLSGGVAFVSALLAIVSLAFAMQRASEEDQSRLRSDLTSIIRRVTALNGKETLTQAQANELAALLAQAKAIFPQLDSVPAVYYSEISYALLKGYYYGDSLEYAEKALRQAKDDEDVIQEIVARQYSAATYRTLQDFRKMRSEYSQAVALSEKAQEGPDYFAASELGIATLRVWGNAEARSGACDQAASIFASAVRRAESNNVARSHWLATIASARDRALKTCQQAKSAGASARASAEPPRQRP